MEAYRAAAPWNGPAKPPKRWTSHAGHHLLAEPHRAVRKRAGRDPELSDMSDRMVILDGSSGEGGGQILRTALSLSLLTGRPFRITNIRANREKPGLRPQHLKAVESAAGLADCEVRGASVGSRDLTFRPSPYNSRDLTIDIGTAGSTSLVLHTLHLPVALRASQPVRLSLIGGTFNPKAPAYPFLENAWRSYMALLGLPVALAMPQAGFYPRGGGRLEAWVEPVAQADIQPLVLLERPPLTHIRGVAGVANLRPDIAARMRDRVLSRLNSHGLSAEIELAEWPSPGQGAAISLVAEHEPILSAFVGLGERGKPAEVVADEAVDELLAYEGSAGAVDSFSADQLLLPLVFAPGRSEFTVADASLHLHTNAATIQAFLDRQIEIETPAEGPARVTID